MMRTSGALIPVCDKPLHCPICGGPWHAQKSVPHLGRSLAQGYFKAQETVHVCANLGYMRELHNSRSDQFRDAMASDGGWPLHIDATGEDGRGTMLVVYSGWRQWVLDFKADSTGYDYPFDRPFLDLYDRCKEVRRAIDAFIHNKPSDPNVLKYLKRLHRILGPVASEVPFRQTVRRLRSRAVLLDKLRDALRISIMFQFCVDLLISFMRLFLN